MAGELEQFLKDFEWIDAGEDSEVYKSKSDDSVIKIYSNLKKTYEGRFSLNSCFKIVQRYNSDTLKAKENIDSRWKKRAKVLEVNDVVLNGKKYEVTVTIVPQGELRLIEDQVVSVGQTYVPGLSFKQICEHSEKIEGFEDFYNAPNSAYSRIRQILATASYLIKVPDNVLFQIDNKNIKPIIDDERGTLNLVVTDLSASIDKDYKY